MSWLQELLDIFQRRMGVDPQGSRTSSRVQNDFAGRCLRALRARKVPINVGNDVTNILYVEGCNTDGTPNRNRSNAFDDARIVLRVEETGLARILGAWEATTEPGAFWTAHRMNPAGAFHIPLGYQAVWKMGEYHGHPALVQVLPIHGTRDDNEDFSRVGDEPDFGQFGVHHHGSSGRTRDDMGRSSAGCQVGMEMAGHLAFIRLISTDRRYHDNPDMIWGSTVLAFSEVA